MHDIKRMYEMFSSREVFVLVDLGLLDKIPNEMRY